MRLTSGQFNLSDIALMPAGLLAVSPLVRRVARLDITSETTDYKFMKHVHQFETELRPTSVANRSNR
jgi:hypothetical protein